MRIKPQIINYAFLIYILCVFNACQGQDSDQKKQLYASGSSSIDNSSSRLEKYIKENKDNGQPSSSKGTVSNGALINGKLMPFHGDNFFYFDTASYLGNRAFLNAKVKKTALESYEELNTVLPHRHFCIMECSNKHGGKIFPHRTHQNGLSIDFMMPLTKKNKPYYGLDSMGQSHYFLEFNDKGQYSSNKEISIDFDVVAQHILILDKEARKNGLKISKVIIKTELKDELFNTVNGGKLKNSGIYITQNLTPLINSLHDDHYHIDFEEIN